MLLRADNINELVFSNNSIDAGDFFEQTSTQGRVAFGKYCSNVCYTENTFTDSGFLRFKEIAIADDIGVWAQVNSKL